MTGKPQAEHVDVLIVGAGISGIDAAYRVQTELPGKSYAVLEAREAIGGTWDLFRYPGIRSDSDMYTLGFPFRPWRGEKSIADGSDIRSYVEETAREFGIGRHIRFNHRAVRPAWSSADALWTVEVEAEGVPRTFTCAFLFLCAGYYDYAGGYRPEWPGEEAFGGRFVHPQFWPADLDYSGKRVVVIGSGATAVTLVPEMAKTAAHVTMLQRSPTWIVSMPSRDPIARWAQRRLPERAADGLVRWKNILFTIAFFNYSRRWPGRVKKVLLKGARKALPEGYDVERDFQARYDPWDQRLCLVPDADLFAAIKAGKAEVVTDTIERFTANGVRLASGRELEADVVVTATGLVIKLLGGMALEVDGAPVKVGDTVAYKGMMLSGVPNMALSFGYTNASWTLKCDLTARYVCRLLKHMAAKGARIAVPRLPEGGVERAPLLDFSSGYVTRAAGHIPAQGTKAPWRLHQNYLKDLLALGRQPVEDEAMEFR
ncbi:MAG TPA: NAD(P)/FAD-dependent oxidoreductase [Allosphingosinicella sp.]|jgi:cation diffusion facilitator CzcD-associated flavoprotein CzcO